MHILSKKAVRELVLYPPQHIARLETAGLFPTRLACRPNRLSSVESKVLEWLKECLKQRRLPLTTCAEYGKSRNRRSYKSLAVSSRKVVKWVFDSYKYLLMSKNYRTWSRSILPLICDILNNFINCVTGGRLLFRTRH